MGRLYYYSSAAKSGSSPTVLLIHGLERLPFTMSTMGWRFRRAGWNVIQYTYPCHEITFYKASDKLRKLLNGLTQDQFPTHALGFSMGGIVLHELLKETPVIPRAVLLGSPLLHSQAARRTLQLPLSRKILGPSLEELAKDREWTAPNGVELATIAGYGPIASSWNPVLEGPNDGLVRVEEAIPNNSTLSHQLPSVHIGLVFYPQPFQIAKKFLEKGVLPKQKRTE